MVDNFTRSTGNAAFPEVIPDSADGVEKFSARSGKTKYTDDFDTPGGIRTLLRRIVENFPVVQGKRTSEKAWTTKALRNTDSKLPLPSQVSRNAVNTGRKGIPPMLYKIAATLGTDAPAERREKNIVRLVEEAAAGKDPAVAMSEFAKILGASVDFSNNAFKSFFQENRSKFGMADLILSTSTVCFALACISSCGGIPLILRTGLGTISFPESTTVRYALSIIQTAANEAYSDTPMDFYELRTLLSGESEKEDREAENNGEEYGETSDGRILAFLNNFSIMENMILGLLKRGEGKNNKTREPYQELAAMVTEGIAYVEAYNRNLFAELVFLPSPEGALEEIREHTRYALWPGVTEVYWKEGPLRRVRLLPRPDGWTRAAIELERDGELRVFLREIPRKEDTEEWGYIIDNCLEDTRRGYADPTCAAVEALRVCVVAKERKIAPGTVRRVPTGNVRAGIKPRAGDVVMRYVPRYVPLGDGTSGRTGEIPSFSFERSGRTFAVIGHLRQICKTHKASDECRAAAEAAGIPLPEYGQTFVRPHTRGEEGNVQLVRARKNVSNHSSNHSG